MTVKTKSGFKFTLNEKILTDYRLVDAIAMTTSEKDAERIVGTTQIVNLLFGDKKSEYMAHIANKNDGFVPTEVINAELLDLMGEINKLKNSSSSGE